MALLSPRRASGDDLAFLGQSLTPSPLVRPVSPRHDRPPALTTPSVGGTAPERAALHVSGVRGNKAGRPARITPRDLCRVVNPRRQPARWRWPDKPKHRKARMTSPYLDR